MAEQKNLRLQTIIGAVIAVGLGSYFFGGGLQQKAASDLHDIENKVARDAVQEYEIAQRNGKPMDVCVHRFVSAAYLQAKDEPNYQRWKQTETADCAKAGIQK